MLNSKFGLTAKQKLNAIEYADVIQFVSDFQMEEYGLIPEKCFVIPNMVKPVKKTIKDTWSEFSDANPKSIEKEVRGYASFSSKKLAEGLTLKEGTKYQFTDPVQIQKGTKNLWEELKKIFPAENWIRDFKPKPETSHEEEIIEIEGNVEIEIKTFLKTASAGILVLDSMSLKGRDSWMTYLLSEATNYSIPQVETWSHSSRISKKIF
jgi:hypothetical protein